MCYVYMKLEWLFNSPRNFLTWKNVPKLKPKALKLEELGSNLDSNNIQKMSKLTLEVLSTRRTTQ
jgi:hypothetical protein